MTATTAARQLDSENPWPGLESFSEGAHDFFFGRDREAESLLNHVRDASVTVLYGRSGLGKTSLLRAGLFPALREENFLPVYVRLELQQGSTALSRQLHQSVCDSIRSNLPDALLPADDESLWEYLHRKDFELWSAQNYPLTPVIVIDQFEELFTLGERVPDLVREFMNDLGDLAENRIPADVAARIDDDEAEAARFQLRAHNYKLLITLREDYLPHLEEWSQLIPALKRSRVRLLPLRANKAFDAVYKPAAHLMSTGLAERVVRIVAGEDLSRGRDSTSTNGDRSSDGTSGVEPALLSLFCRELNEERKRRGQPEFDEHLVEDAKRDILSNYYLACVRDLPPRVAEFIESELITEKGFRDSYAREDAVPSRLTQDELSALIGSRLLRLEEYHGAQRIELTHDVLTGVVREHRDRRRVEEEKAALAARAEEEKQALAQATERHAAELEREREVGRRLRKRSTALAVVCVAAVVMATVAVISAVWAKRSSDEADARSKEALAERLTSQAQAMLAGGQPGSELQALDKLLAAQAISANPDLGALLTTLRNEARLSKVIDLPLGGGVLSADGQRIVTSTPTGVQLLLDTGTGQEVRERFAAGGRVKAASPNGRYLAIGNGDKAVQVWDSATGKPIGPAITIGEDWLPAVAVSPDGNRLATAGVNTRLWDARTGRQVGPPLSGPDAPVLALAFSPDAHRLASAGRDRTVKFWDASSGVKLRETVAVADPRLYADDSISSLSFSPDGHFIAAGGMTVGLGTLLSAGMPLRIWNTDSGAAVGEPRTGNYGTIYSVAFSPDGARVVTGGFDKFVRLWDGHTGEPVGTPLKLQSPVQHVAFTRDGSRIVAVSGDTAQVIYTDPDSALATQVGGSKVTQLTAMQSGYGINDDKAQPRIMVLRDGALRQFDADTGEPAGQVIASDALVGGTQISFTRDDRWLAVIGRDKDVRVLDALTGQQRGAPMTGHQDSVNTVAFSPDGQLLATGSDDNTVRLWDWKQGQQIGEALTGHKYGVQELVFSEDGRRLYSLSDDSIRIWDTASRQPIGKPIEARIRLKGMNISHDGRRIAAADGQTIHQWDAASGEAVGERLAGHDDFVQNVEYSPDDSLLVSVSSDRTLRFWDTATGQQIGEPIATIPVGSTQFVDFSHDGRRVFVVAQKLSLDNKPPFVGGGIWQIPAPATWRDAVCDKLTSNPSDKEWKDWVSDDIPNRELCPNKPNAPQ